MIVFNSATQGRTPGSKFFQFHSIQAILMNFKIMLLSWLPALLPTAVKASFLWIEMSTFLYFGVVGAILYSWALIACGKYTNIPYLSEMALQYSGSNGGGGYDGYRGGGYRYRGG